MAKPIDKLFSDPTACHRFAEDVSIHWFPGPLADRCFCGERTQDPEPDEDAMPKGGES